MEERMEKKDEEIQEKVEKVLPQISWAVSLKNTKMYYYFCRNLIFTTVPHTHQINLQFFANILCNNLLGASQKLFKGPKIDSHSVLFFE